MSKQSDQLREQAKRAKRLSKAIGNEETSRRLKDIAQQFDDDADRLDRGEKPQNRNDYSTQATATKVPLVNAVPRCKRQRGKEERKPGCQRQSLLNANAQLNRNRWVWEDLFWTTHIEENCT